jgi:hypothetical protein
MLDWFAASMWSALFHWLAYWSVGVIIIAAAGAAAWFSPFFKELFIGIAAGAALLLGAQSGLVSFKPKDPQTCIHPPTDPNGPSCQKWHATDDRGFGYWEPCE